MHATYRFPQRDRTLRGSQNLVYGIPGAPERRGDLIGRATA